MSVELYPDERLLVTEAATQNNVRTYESVRMLNNEQRTCVYLRLLFTCIIYGWV